jgi:hypothetical protein
VDECKPLIGGILRYPVNLAEFEVGSDIESVESGDSDNDNEGFI